MSCMWGCILNLMVLLCIEKQYTYKLYTKPYSLVQIYSHTDSHICMFIIENTYK